MEEYLDDLEEQLDELQKKFYGVVTGRVMDVLDPMAMGRVRVQISMIDDVDFSAWARVAVPIAGMTYGSYWIPDIGNEVLIAFENGDLNVPYIIGSLWSVGALPPLPSPLPQIRTLRTLAGNQIVFTEVPPTVTIQTGPTPPVPAPTPPSPAGPPTIFMSPAGIQIVMGTNVINMTPAGTQITAGSNMINMTPDGITISAAANLNLSAGGMVNILAGGTCSITAPLVKIN